MCVRFTLPAVPAAAVILLTGVASASPVCVFAHALPGNAANLAVQQCVPSSFVSMCRAVWVEAGTRLAYAEACVPKPPSQ